LFALKVKKLLKRFWWVAVLGVALVVLVVLQVFPYVTNWAFVDWLPASAHWWVGNGGAHGFALFFFGQMVSNRYVDNELGYQVVAVAINFGFVAGIVSSLSFFFKK
jgi:hypothetical protein